MSCLAFEKAQQHPATKMAISDLVFHGVLIYLLFNAQKYEWNWNWNLSPRVTTPKSIQQQPTLLPLFTLSLFSFCIYFHKYLNFALAGISGLILSNALLLLWLRKSHLEASDFLLFYWASETRDEIDLAIAEAKKVMELVDSGKKSPSHFLAVRARQALDSYRHVKGPVIVELAKTCAACFVTILVLPGLLEAQEVYPAFQILSPLDIKSQFYYLLHGLTLYCCIELTYSLVGASFAFYFDIPLRRSFHAPFQSKTVGDLWSRWNLPVQTMLKKGAYDPFYNLFVSSSGSLTKVPLWLAKAGAVLLTFLISALYHEFIVYFTQQPDSIHPLLEQTSFFMIHALVVIFESLILTTVKTVFKVDVLEWIPVPMLQLYVLVFTLCTSPLMLNPYLRERVYHNLLF